MDNAPCGSRYPRGRRDGGPSIPTLRGDTKMANEDLLLRQMPHSLEAEQAALGAMLIDADCIKDVMDKLQPEDF